MALSFNTPMQGNFVTPADFAFFAGKTGKALITRTPVELLKRSKIHLFEANVNGKVFSNTETGLDNFTGGGASQAASLLIQLKGTVLTGTKISLRIPLLFGLEDAEASALVTQAIDFTVEASDQTTPKAMVETLIDLLQYAHGKSDQANQPTKTMISGLNGNQTIADLRFAMKRCFGIDPQTGTPFQVSNDTAKPTLTLTAGGNGATGNNYEAGLFMYDSDAQVFEIDPASGVPVGVKNAVEAIKYDSFKTTATQNFIAITPGDTLQEEQFPSTASVAAGLSIFGTLSRELAQLSSTSDRFALSLAAGGGLQRNAGGNQFAKNLLKTVFFIFPSDNGGLDYIVFYDCFVNINGEITFKGDAAPAVNLEIKPQARMGGGAADRFGSQYYKLPGNVLIA
jgi:hypothetical protein